ncbi:TPM domain-containing protein [Blattabacterium cuenoti]|uniref:TPM domain-containing protein n=1 Tax=Blattabacterium cuenoti TaxID=1653831 RepID=UPI001EEB7196|nr:TPM domain-containing protein [Blattabacterium cuenoti]
MSYYEYEQKVLSLYVMKNEKKFVMIKKNYIIKTINFLFFLFICTTNLVQGKFNIPEPTPGIKKIYPVQDYAGILSKTHRNTLNKKLFSYSKITSTEIVVCIIQNLHGEDPNLLACKWGDQWKIGKKHKDNGVMILLSIQDKKMSIQNGYGIEPYITDFSSKRIIQKTKPLLRRNLFYKALDFSTNEIFVLLKKKFFNEKEKKKLYLNIHNEKKYKNHYFSLYFLLFPISVLLMTFFLSISKKNKIEIEFYSLFMNTILTDFLLKNQHLQNHNENEDNFDGFDGFGGGGLFGGGGSSDKW